MRRFAQIVMLSATACVSVPASPVVGRRLPAVAPVPLSDSQSPLTEAIAGRVALIDFWASWCEPCKATVPKLERLSAAFTSTDVVVIGVNVGEEAPLVREFAEGAGVTYPLYLDSKFEFSDAVGARFVPMLLLIDRTGTIVHRTRALDRSTLARIRELVERRVDAAR